MEVTMQVLLLLSEGGEGPNTELLWILGILLGFFALAVISGWLSTLMKPQTVPAKNKSESKKEADDLTLIEGIGPKVKKVLVGAGIETFADLAVASESDLNQILERAGLHMMNPESWSEQAKLASKGKLKELEKLQRTLKGGRKS